MPKHPPRPTSLQFLRIVAAPLLLLTFLLPALFSPATAGASSSKAAVPAATQAVRLIHQYFPASAWPEAVHVASCESTFNTDAVHYDSDGTRDLGLFQLNTGGTEQELLGLTHHSTADLDLAFNPTWNVSAAALLYQRDGWSRWSCAT